MGQTSVDYLAILETLCRHGVEFIIVGGVGAVLQGAPLTTFDLDVVHSREPNNLDRIMSSLQELDAHYRILGHVDKKPDLSHLASPGHQLLMTRFGPLDLLGTIGQDDDYARLLKETSELEISQRLKVRVLSLEGLIRTKEATGQEKDKAVLPVLRQVLQEKSR